MEYWNVILEYERTYSDDGTDEDILDAFADWHPAVGRSLEGRMEATLSIPADDLKQAARTAMALISENDSLPEVCRMNVLKASEHDRTNGLSPVPTLLSVSEAAAILNVSRQRVLQLIHDGRMHGIRVGNGWALYRTEVDEMRNASHGRPRHSR